MLTSRKQDRRANRGGAHRVLAIAVVATLALAAWPALAAGPKVALFTAEVALGGKKGTKGTVFGPSGVQKRLVDRLEADGFTVAPAPTLPSRAVTAGREDEIAKLVAAAAGFGGSDVEFVVSVIVDGTDDARVAFGSKVFAYPARARVHVRSTRGGTPVEVVVTADHPATDKGAARAVVHRLLADAAYPKIREALLGGPAAKILTFELDGVPGHTTAERISASLTRLPGVRIARVRFGDASRTRIELDVSEDTAPADLAAAINADSSFAVEVEKSTAKAMHGRYTRVGDVRLAVAVGKFAVSALAVPGAVLGGRLLTPALDLALTRSIYLEPKSSPAVAKALAAGGSWLGDLQAAGIGVAITGTVSEAADVGADQVEITVTLWDTAARAAAGTVKLLVPGRGIPFAAVPLADAIDEAVLERAGTLAPGRWYPGTKYEPSRAAVARASGRGLPLVVDAFGGPGRAPKATGAVRAVTTPLPLYPAFAAWHRHNAAAVVRVKNLATGTAEDVHVRLTTDELGVVAEGGIDRIKARRSADVELRYRFEPGVIPSEGVLSARLELSWRDGGRSESTITLVPLVIASRVDRPVAGLGAFVTPDDPVIAGLAANALDLARASDIEALPGALGQTAALWNLLGAMGIGVPAGLPESATDPLSPVRAGRDVLKAKTGTPAEVAALFASLIHATGGGAHFVATDLGPLVAVDVGPPEAAEKSALGVWPIRLTERVRAVAVLDPRDAGKPFHEAWKLGVTHVPKSRVAKGGVLVTEWVEAAWGRTPAIRVSGAAPGVPAIDKARFGALNSATVKAWTAVRDARLAAERAELDERFPGDPSARYLTALARIHWEVGDIVRAREMLTRARSLPGEEASIDYGLGRIALATGEVLAAIPILERAAAAAPGAVRNAARRALAIAHALTDKPDEARRVLAGVPGGAELVALLGLGKRPVAEGPRPIRVAGPAGKIARSALKDYESGSYDAAGAALAAAMELKGANADVAFAWAHALWAAGDVHGAAAAFRLYLAQAPTTATDLLEVAAIARDLDRAHPTDAEALRERWKTPWRVLSAEVLPAIPW